MEKVLITGSNGFIGSHLIDYILDKNYEIFALDRPSADFRNLSHYTEGKLKFSESDKLDFCGERIRIASNNTKIHFIECDMKNCELLEQIIKQTKPKFIFHFAAQPYIGPSWEDPIDTFKINVIGTICIFETIKNYQIKTRVILACSSTEYGTTATTINRPLRESDKLLAVHPYGISKITAELLARQYYINFGIEAINLRFFNQTGPRRIQDAPSDFIRKVAQIELGVIERDLEVGNLSPYRDFTDIRDSVKVIWLAATEGTSGETYQVCSNRKIQIRTLLEIATSFSSKIINVIENVSSKLRETDENVIIGDNSKIKSQFNWEATIPIEKTLGDMYDYWIELYKNED